MDIEHQVSQANQERGTVLHDRRAGIVDYDSGTKETSGPCPQTNCCIWYPSMSGGSGQGLQKKAWKKKPQNDRGRDWTTSTAAKTCLGKGVLKRTHPQHQNQAVQ